MTSHSRNYELQNVPGLALLPLLPAWCVMQQALLSIQVSKGGLAGRRSESQDQDPCTHRSLACTHTRMHARTCVDTHTAIPRQGGNQQPGCFPIRSYRGREHCLTSLGNSSGWAEPLYLFVEYLEHLLNPASERYTAH